MKTKIKEVNFNDWKKIVTIQKNDGFSHAYYLTKDRIKRLFERGEKFFLAFLGDKPVGFASVDFEIRARLHFLSVIKDFQRKRIGSLLLEKVIKEARKRKFKKIYIITEKSARKVDRFLRKKGFRRVGYHKNRFGKGKDGIIWELEI